MVPKSDGVNLLCGRDSFKEFLFFDLGIFILTGGGGLTAEGKQYFLSKSRSRSRSSSRISSRRGVEVEVEVELEVEI